MRTDKRLHILTDIRMSHCDLFAPSQASAIFILDARGKVRPSFFHQSLANIADVHTEKAR